MRRTSGDAHALIVFNAGPTPSAGESVSGARSTRLRMILGRFSGASASLAEPRAPDEFRTAHLEEGVRKSAAVGSYAGG